MRYLVPKDRKKRVRAVPFEFRRQIMRSIYFNQALPGRFRIFCAREIGDFGRDASFVRLRNRCLVTGRARSVVRLFGLSRFQFKRLAAEGFLTGVESTGW